MKVYVVCDVRESFPSYVDGVSYNDHPKKENVFEIINIISGLGYDCELFGGIPELIHAYDSNIQFRDCFFLNFTDGLTQDYSRIQAPMLMELLNVAYSGASPFASAVLNNKHYSKLALEGYPVLRPAGILINKILSYSKKSIDNLGYPIIVKPNTGGSSIGIKNDSVCFNYGDTEKKIKELTENFDEIIIEKYIAGYDVTNLLIGNEEYCPINEVIVTESHDKLIQDTTVLGIEEKSLKKRLLHMGQDVLPTGITDKIRSTSMQIKKILNVNDIVRIDYRVTKDGNIYFIEANSMPRISSTSEAGFICKYYDYDFSKIISVYLDVILKRLFPSMD